MAIGFNSGGTTVIKEIAPNTGSGSFGSQITTSGSDRIGFVRYDITSAIYSGGTAAAEWGTGNTMTLLREKFNSGGTPNYQGLFYIINPPTAATTINWSGFSTGDPMDFMAFSAFDVNVNGTPLGPVIDSSSASSLAISSNPGELALAVFAQYNSSTAADAPATTIGFTEYNIFFPIRGVAAYDAGANPTTTISFSGAGIMIGVSLKPVGSSPTSTPGNSTQFLQLLGIGT